MTFSKTIGVQQGSFLFQVLLSISFCFLGALTQTAPGNPIITGPTNAVEGQSVSLRCTTTGGSSPVTVRWQRNTVQVDSTVDGSFTNSLGIAVNYNDYNFTVSRTDNLVSYICLVHNAALSSNLTREWTISVYVQASAPVINGPTTTLDSGNTYTYTCTAASGRPAPEIEWKLGSTVSSATTLGTGTYDPLVTNSDSTFTRISTLSWVPIIGDNGKSLFCIASQSATVPSQNAFRVISVQQIPIIRSAQSAYSTQAGQSVVLRCNVTSAFPAITNAYWEKRGNSGFQRVTTDSRISQASHTTNNPDLTITNAQVSDAGEYRCFATNLAGTGSSGIITLSVTGSYPVIRIVRQTSSSITFSLDSQYYAVQIGQAVTLQCAVIATPFQTSVFWQLTKNGQTQTIDVRGNPNKYGGSNVTFPSLVIKYAESTDHGNYTCSATNAATSATSDIIALSITGSQPLVQIGSAKYTSTVGSSVTLICDVYASLQVNNVYWEFLNSNGQKTNITNGYNPSKYSGVTVQSPSLIINSLSTSDIGTYRCVATNLAGSGSDSTTLEVLGSPPSVSVGQNQYPGSVGGSVTLVCSVTSTLQILNVYWERQSSIGQYQTVDMSLTSKYSGSTVQSPSLVINSLTTGDAGIYRCVAVNLAGNGSDDTVLNIQGNVPSVSIDQDSYSVNEGNTVTLACTVLTSTSTRVTSVRWQKIVNGISSSVNMNLVSKYSGSTPSTPSLTIFNAELADGAQYRCTATNAIGTGQSLTTVLKVIARPVISSGQQGTYSVNYGTNVTLVITISSPDTPILAVNWQKISTGATNYITTGTNKYGGGTISSPSLKIYNVDLSDAGIYRPIITSSAGSTTGSNITLNVIGNVPSVVIGSGSAVIFGQNAFISCTISSNPAASSVYWEKTTSGVTSVLDIAGNSRYIGGSLNSPSLTINNVNLNDRGEYRCLAVNSVGTGRSGAASLDVTGNVPSVTIGSGATVYIGDNTTIACSVYGSPSVTTVSWQRTSSDGTVTNIDVTNTAKYSGGTVNTPSLKINAIVKSDEGYYKCQATNAIGTGESLTTAFLSVIGGLPTAIIGAGVSATVGDQVTVVCSVSGYPRSTAISWKKTANGVVTNIDFSQSRYSGGVPSNPSLIITNVQKTDEGDYQCSATNIIGTSESGTAFLSVLGSIPSINIPSRSYTVNYGASIRLQCVINSIPPANKVTWQKTIRGITSEIVPSSNKYNGASINEPSLTIFNADVSDEGKYVCSASNIVGTSSSGQITLNVIVSFPTVQVGNTAYTASTGSSVTLVCNIFSSNPAATAVIWEKDVNGVATNVFNIMSTRISGATLNIPSLTISNVQQSDAGTYYCYARNSVGNGAKVNTTLIVQTIPGITTSQTLYDVSVQNSVTLSCSITSSPQATSVTWERIIGGQKYALDTTDSRYDGGTVAVPSLTILNVTLSDAGTYICSSTNAAGTGYSDPITLNVAGNPPSITILRSVYQVSFTSDVTLVCIVTSSLQLGTFTWRKYSGSTPVNLVVSGNSHYSGGTIASTNLTVHGATFTDEAFYDCQATNAAGTSTSSQIFLDVVGNVPNVTIPQAFYQVTAGGTVTIRCNVSSNPFQISVEWQRINSGVSTAINVTAEARYSGGNVNTPSLTITNAVSGDAGIYVCSASNNYGKGVSGQTNLTVLGNLADVTITQSSYSVLRGSGVTIECQVENALPSVTSVKWYRGSDPNNVNTEINVLSNSKYSGGTVATPSLNITNVQPSDEGYYLCAAINLVGTASNITFLDVYGDTPTITVTNTFYSVVVGQPVTLNCDYHSSPPPTSISWQRVSNFQSYPINVSEPRYSGGTILTPYLTILNTHLSDTAYYLCSVTNGVGTTTSPQIALRIDGSVPTVTIPQSSYSVNFGDSVTLECNVDSVPTATNVSWIQTRNNVNKNIDITSSKYSGSTVSNPNLTISNTDLSDEGSYICSATNIVGTSSSAPRSLDVIGDRPTINIGQTSSYNILIGNSVTLTCIPSGTPTVFNVFWTRTRSGTTSNVVAGSTGYGSVFSNGNVNSPSLTLTNAQQADSGTYTCKAQNAAGTTDSSPIFLTVSGTQPTVSIPQNSYSVVTTQNATITCSVSAIPNANSIWWTFITNSGFQTNITTSTSKYTLTGISGTSSTLFIRNTATSDSGTYRCTATNSVGQGSDSATLSVTGSVPVLTFTQSSYNVLYGTNAFLQCSISANPTAQIATWYFVTRQLTIQTSSSKYTVSTNSIYTTTSLTVINTDSSDEGTYICRAGNQVGTGSASANLTITGSLPSVNIPQSSYSTVTGQDATLTCSVSANPSATSIQWTFFANSGAQTSISSSTSKYTLIGTSGTSSTLIITSTTTSDAGTYRCVASNNVGQGSDSSTLSVSGTLPTVSIPQNSYGAVTGQDATLTCSASANPTATSIQWTFFANSGVQTAITGTTSKYSLTGTSGTSSTLVIHATTTSDSGTYRCTAINSVGQGSDSATLSVTGTLPTVNIPQSSYGAVTGQDATITCSVSANPTATSIQWTFFSNSGAQTSITSSTSDYTITGTSGTSSTLVIHTTTTSDSGTYRCTASNSVGQGSDSATLSVTGSLPTVSIPQNSYGAVTGQDATITCSVSANPTATSIQWTFFANSGAQTSITSSTSKYTLTGTSGTSSTLIVRTTTTSDSGTYRCSASNSVGQGSDSATLSVSGSLPTVNIPQNSYGAVTGQDATITCSVSANPTATSIQWTFFANSGAQTSITSSTSKYTLTGTSGTSSTLIVRTTTTSDSGTYRCSASNSVGQGSDSATLSVSGTRPTVNIPQNSYSAVTGQDATITCSVSANPTASSIQWTFFSNSGSQTSISVSTSKYTLTGTSGTSSTLIIRTTTTSDSGTYRCSATNTVGQGSDSAVLSVSGSRPTVNIPQNSYSAVTGQDATITCSVSANPTASSIQWTFFSNSGSQTSISISTSKYTLTGTSGTSSTLIVRTTTTSDSGTYRCSATNSVGQGSDSTSLSVSGTLPTVNIPQTSYSVVTGQDSTITCSVSANPLASSIQWTFFSNSGGQFSITSTTSKYTISGTSGSSSTLIIKTTTSSDSGTYRCSATNTVGQGSDSAALTVTGSTPSVNIPQTSYSSTTGQDVTIVCSVSANPSVNSVSWTFISSSGNQNSIIATTSKYTVSSAANDHTIVIKNTSVSDAGTYRCSATNSVGTESDQATLSVSGSLPTVTIPQSVYSSITGQSATITCSVSAIPTATSITWRFVSLQGSQTPIQASTTKYTLFSSSTSSSLTILNTAATDSGTYTCIATNAVGDASNTTTLSVSGSRPVVNIPANTYSSIVGQNASIPCSVSANPDITSFAWTFTSTSGSQIQISTPTSKYSFSSASSDRTLTVLSAVSSDSGTYTCSATNLVGTSSDQAVLSVTGNVPNVNIPQTSYSSTIGNNVAIQCFITASPSVTSVVWSFTSVGGAQISIPTSTSKYTLAGTLTAPQLTVIAVSTADSGTYTCSGSNSVGTASDVTTLSVTGSTPTVIIPLSSYSVVLGNDVVIPCTVSAVPAANPVSWLFTSNSNNQIAISSSSSKYTFNYFGGSANLTVRIAATSDAGVYRCQATNIIGTGTDSARLDVLGSIPTVTLQQTNYAITYGQNVTLQCTVTASPAATSATWQKAVGSGYQDLNPQTSSKYSVAALPNPALTIVGVTFTDSAQYRCTATNQVGQGVSTTATVQVQGEKPSVSLPQNSYMPVVGTNVTILCSVSVATNDPPVTSVSWKKATLSGTGIITVTQSIKYSGSTVDSPNLIIQNVDSNDNGNYSCLATNARGTSESPFATLQVTGSAPSVNIPQSSYSTVIGTSILIPCSVSATPDVTSFQWTFQPSTGGSVTITQSGGRYELNTNWQSPSLRVVNTTFGDTGTYTCRSTNIVGTISDSTALTITGTVPNVTLSQASYSVLKGQNITLDCRVTGGDPPEITAIKWKYRATVSSSPNTLNVNSNQNKYVGSTVANPNLTIINVVDGDQGLYACIASNLYGDGESDQVLLDVTGSAPTVVVTPSALSVTQTQNVTITCSVTGADPAIRDVRWEKHSSGGQVTQITIGGRFSGATTSNPSLTISFVEPSDAGIYYCTAENLVASTKSTTECSLTVTGSAPSSVSITRGGSVVTTTTVSRGSSITLTCAASGSPAPTFSWRFGGTQVATGNSYTINSVAKNQDGVYTCRATNLLSSADGTVTVDVQYAPEDVRTTAQRVLTGSVGGTVQLSCNVDSDPTPSYRWYRNNVLISTVTTKDYSVPINSNDDFGSYSCAAQNSLGTATLAFTISNAGTGNTGASTASSGLSTGEIAAIVLALLLLLLLIIIIIICCITHGVCGAICGKKDTKGRVEPVEKEVYKETSKEVIIPRFHEESIKGKREGYGKPGSYRSYPPRAHQYWEPSAISRKDVDVRVHQNGHFRKENDYEIVRYETVPATSTHVITESPRAPRRLPKLEYSYEDVAEKKRKRRKKRQHKRRRGAEEVEVIETVRSESPVRIVQEEPVEEVVVERVIRSRSASPTRVYRTETEEPMVVERIIRSSSPTRIVRQESEEPVGYGQRSPERGYRGYHDDRIVEQVRTSSRSPSRRRRVKEDEEMIIERSSRSPSTRRRHEENFMTTEEHIGNGDVIHGEGDLRAYNGVVYREAPSRHSSGRYYIEGGSMRRSHSGRRDYGSDDEVEVVYGKEYVVEH